MTIKIQTDNHKVEILLYRWLPRLYVRVDGWQHSFLLYELWYRRPRNVYSKTADIYTR